MTKTTLIDRAVIRLAGEGTRNFLQGLVTNDVLGPLPVWAGLLTPQGKALFDFLIWAEGDDLLIDCEAAQAEALVRRLALYRLRLPITLKLDETRHVHWSLTPPSDVSACRDPRMAELGWRWIGAECSQGDASAAWHAHRLGLGIVEGAAELGQDQTLWLECNAREQHGVSFTKGCYVGQENTARMHHRDKVNRRLDVVFADVDPGDRVRVWHKEFGIAVLVGRAKPTI
jgi:tRNA-modifying protein YgfZ